MRTALLPNDVADAPAQVACQRKAALACLRLTLAALGFVLCMTQACFFARAITPETMPVLVITNDTMLEPGAKLAARLVVRTSHVTIDGRGATLTGPGRPGNVRSFDEAGIGILVEGAVNVTLRNIRAHGFLIGLVVRKSEAVTVEGCDFSENYHNPDYGWGELPARGGILLQESRRCVIRNTRANRVWDGIHLIDSDENLVTDCDFSECSNTCAKLWKASRNRFLRNNLSYGIRIDRSRGEVHARDSAGVLIETGSDDNYWYQNDITHGGDGVFIRPLNRWVSRGNVFVENDMSYANNNCVESWSPGNVFIRNKANHGSYGFWLGGSDQTILIGNEAAYNGLTNGWHNAPEPGFGHGGIVIVGGPSSHTIIDGNHLHHNNGAGIAFRGDVESKGTKWRTEHWIIQRNKITDNRFGVWGRWGRAILIASNIITNNAEGNLIRDVEDLIEIPSTTCQGPTPRAIIAGPEIGITGQPVKLDASMSFDPAGLPLNYLWWLNGPAGNKSSFERTFDRPGFYRISLTVHNNSVAALAWRDLLIVDHTESELGTERNAHDWGFEFEPQDANGRILFEDDPAAIVGSACLRFRVDPYPGAYATAVFPRTRDGDWNFEGKNYLRVWIKALNPNLPGWQNAGPVVRIIGANGWIEYKPADDANLLNDPPYSEARWTWALLQIPLSGDRTWTRMTTGNVDLQHVKAISISLDSWGGDPFTVWLDGLSVK